MQLANQEISHGAVDAPGVDLCVSFLLRHHLVEDAARIHQAHADGVKARSLEAVYASSESVNARKTLLDAHKRVPQITGFNNRCVEQIVSFHSIFDCVALVILRVALRTLSCPRRCLIRTSWLPLPPPRLSSALLITPGPPTSRSTTNRSWYELCCSNRECCSWWNLLLVVPILPLQVLLQEA